LIISPATATSPTAPDIPCPAWCCWTSRCRARPRQQEQFARLPVIIYTSSGGEDDRERARALGATEYTVKKADVGDMAEWLRGVIHYCEPEPAQA